MVKAFFDMEKLTKTHVYSYYSKIIKTLKSFQICRLGKFKRTHSFKTQFKSFELLWITPPSERFQKRAVAFI